MKKLYSDCFKVQSKENTIAPALTEKPHESMDYLSNNFKKKHPSMDTPVINDLHKLDIVFLQDSQLFLGDVASQQKNQLLTKLDKTTHSSNCFCQHVIAAPSTSSLNLAKDDLIGKIQHGQINEAEEPANFTHEVLIFDFLNIATINWNQVIIKKS